MIEFVARALVENPGDVHVDEIVQGGQTTYELTVADDDLGKVIGRGGRMARSLRTLLAAASLRTRKKSHLEILE
ncbi:KH domain-containing protein [bacterium]|nr:KH domain-containing protein [bacterium]